MKIAIPETRFLKSLALVDEYGCFSWKSCVPEDAFVVGDQNHQKSVAPVFELLDIKQPNLLSPENTKSFDLFEVKKEEIFIDGAQPNNEMISFIKSSFKASRVALESLQSLGYLDIFMESQRTIKRLERALVDMRALKLAMQSKKIKNASIAKTFYPKKDGFLKLPKYSITKTLTGRMTIVDGPQMLTAPKIIRSFLKSSYAGGKIIQIDFISHEPRTAMLLTEKNLGVDIYEYLGEKLFDKKVSRSVVKKLVLCAVYGASESTLKKGLPSGINIRQLVDKTKQILNYDMVVKEQSKNFKKTGKINNFFGRPIQPQDSRDSLLYNNYIQSTAVDVALTGFGKILDKSSYRARPIFFIHDAMLLDVHPEDIEGFKSICKSIDIDGLGEFPLDFQVLE